jgi:60 kDa SS-A/Ro ribonucleoprotein
MALLRNLRNFLQNDLSNEILDSNVILKLTNEKIIRNSKQFPFRFLSAYREIEKVDEGVKLSQKNKVLQALEIAIDISIANLPELGGKSALFADNSGSMTSPLSDRSKLQLYDVSNIMLCIADRMTNHQAILGSFASDLVILEQVGDTKEKTILQNASQIHEIDVGGSTDTWKCLDYLISNKINVDRILVFTDEESYDSNHRSYGFYENSVATLLKKYKREVNKDVYFYNINLNGYGTTQTPQDEPNTCLIGGWSERILSYISEFEKDSKQMIERINNHEF